MTINGRQLNCFQHLTQPRLLRRASKATYRSVQMTQLAQSVHPLILQHRHGKHIGRTCRIEELIMHAVQLELRTTRIRNPTPICTLKGMTTTKRVIHPSDRALLIRAAVERDDPAESPIRVTAVGLAMRDIMNTVADILVMTGEAIFKDDVEGLWRPVSPWLVIWHSRVTDGHHGAVACFRIGLAPAIAAEAASGVSIHVTVNAVEAVGAVVPGEGGHGPGWQGTAIGW